MAVVHAGAEIVCEQDFERAFATDFSRLLR
jgi:hypothetical protein